MKKFLSYTRVASGGTNGTPFFFDVAIVMSGKKSSISHLVLKRFLWLIKIIKKIS